MPSTDSVRPSLPKRLLALFTTFFRIGAFTFGGGLAMLPLIQREAVEKHHWISDDDILEIVAIAESTPGPIAVNSATFIGWRVAGVLGSACATLGVILPSFLIISVIARVLAEFSSLKPVQYAFYGIRAGVLALILKSFVTMFKKCPRRAIAYSIAAAAFVAAALFDVNVLIIIPACAVVGLISSLVGKEASEK